MTFALLASVSCASGGEQPAQGQAVAAPTTSPPSPHASPTPSGPPVFSAKVTKVSRDRLPYSWKRGCPVHYQDLRLITMTYWGFDSKAHTGELVVRKTVTDDIVTVFKKLYGWRWPIRKMQLVDVYKGDDFDSIEADNTSAFNCRAATGSTHWSNHAYGEAVDINTIENPYVTASGSTAHKASKRYTTRPMKGKGVINPDDKVVRAFAAVGWEWGGTWSGAKDFQHFSKGGG
ncbi:M15 family metallopeptidase [Nonomuraea sediminis]|uniref:M15 family metallopeptidase n=1 Tax=Nonomuraea sediminis TaxID=2835864 RepID=UPI001BDDBF22|nr:M15 family metallopeptidase [Nonomuraea sediminis]